MYYDSKIGSVTLLPSEMPPRAAPTNAAAGTADDGGRGQRPRQPPPPGAGTVQQKHGGSYHQYYYGGAGEGGAVEASASPATDADTLAGDYGLGYGSLGGGDGVAYFGGADGLSAENLQVPREASSFSDMDLSRWGNKADGYTFSECSVVRQACSVGR